jgi:hypothetical protein
MAVLDADERIKSYLTDNFVGKVPDRYLKSPNLRTVHQTLLQYFYEHIGQEIRSEEVERVAGQRETPRRIRELRVEFGYNIGVRRRGRQYLYLFDGSDPDVGRAAWWRLCNNVRRDSSVPSREKALLVLKARLGEIISRTDLQYVGNIQEVMRRVRELRGEHGWRISTGLNRAGLRPDEYVLESLGQRPENDRVDAKTFDAVLKRDDYTCTNCGWRKGDPETQGRRFLEVHHRVPVVLRGRPTLDNLRTLCNVCHDAIPAERAPQ